MAAGSLVTGVGGDDGPVPGDISGVGVSILDNGTPSMFAASQRLGFTCNEGNISVWGEVTPDEGFGQTITAWASDGVNTISNPDTMFVVAPFSLIVQLVNDNLGPGGAIRSFVQVNILSGGIGGISLQVTNPPGIQPPLPALSGPADPFIGGRQSGEGVAFDDFSGGDAFASLFDSFNRPNGAFDISDCGAPWVAVSPIGVPGGPSLGQIVSHVGHVEAGDDSDLNVTLRSSGLVEGGALGPVLTGYGRI